MGVQEKGGRGSAVASMPVWRINKNVALISLAFTLHFTAYQGVANLQSSINAEAGLGTASLAAVYAGLIFSNLFLSVVLIKWVGTKWSMVISFVSYMPYIAVQLWPRFYSLVPAAILLGFGAAPLWCAKCTYLSIVADLYSKVTRETSEAMLVRFLGLFFMTFQTSQVWGNLISSVVLTSGDNKAAVTSVNASLIPQVCGANFLPSADAGDALPPQPEEKIQMMAGIYLACMVGAALLVAVAVDSLKKFESDRSKAGAMMSNMQLLSATLKLLREPNQALLVMVNIFVGYQQAFFGADFSAAFVSCIVGTGSVGYVMMTLGMADAIGCLLTGYIAKIVGRVPLICSAMLFHGLLFIFLLVWRPAATGGYALFVVAVMWGLADSIWIVQINSFSGILFPGREEAAFSNFRLWESVGYVIAYILSPYIRTSSKIYILFVLMIIGSGLYFVVEWRECKRKSREEKERGENEKYGIDNAAFQNIHL